MLSLATATVVGGGLLTQHAFAASTTNSDNLIARIATKFNLNQTEVQAVADQFHTDKIAEMQQKEADRLTQAVTDGKITAAQKDLLTAKQAELKTKFEEIRAMTDKAARKTAMDTLRTETEAWATKNNIDKQWLHFMGGHGGKGPHDMEGPGGMKFEMHEPGDI